MEYRNDWKNNFSSIYAEQTLQQTDAKAYLDNLKNYDDITITGHSLGGNLALYAALTADSLLTLPGLTKNLLNITKR